ncbi:MAG: WYL domain-containing protein [Alphaproteobacteria bacterium]|nr:WYL domain-containing protein [Alphaproteobacteria bacterium]
MPKNKNAVIRYRYIDELLSNRNRYITTRELADKVNKRLVEDGYESVTLRCIQKDLIDLQDELFGADIIRENIAGKECIRYAEKGFSIFTKKLSEDEEMLLSEVLNTIGQFDGLDNFEWLDALKQRLNISEGRRIISFANNPYLHNSNLLGKLFTTISNKVVIDLSYHTFSDPENVRHVVLHPYLLKQYNNRWYLLGAAEDGYILNFALDRIDDIEQISHIKYMEPDDGIEDRFDDIVGVTLPQDAQVEKILLWVSESQYPYIETKPLHGSQRIIRGARAEQLYKDYGFDDGHFVEICCIINTELKQLIASFIDQVVVLTPTSLRDEMMGRLESLIKKYITRT